MFKIFINVDGIHPVSMYAKTVHEFMFLVALVTQGWVDDPMSLIHQLNNMSQDDIIEVPLDFAVDCYITKVE